MTAFSLAAIVMLGAACLPRRTRLASLTCLLLVALGCLSSCAARRPCTTAPPITPLRTIDYPDEALSFFVDNLPGDRGSGAVTFAIHLRASREGPVLPPGRRTFVVNFETRTPAYAAPECRELLVFLDGVALASHHVGSFVLPARPHDDGHSGVSIHIDGGVAAAGGARCIELVVCGASYPLPAAAAPAFARLVAAM